MLKKKLGQGFRDGWDFILKGGRGTSLGGPVAKTAWSHIRGPGSIPGQGIRSCMPQPRPSAAK